MATGIKDKVAIIGMGCSRFGERWDASEEDLLAEAFDEALADAGLERAQIEAAWFGSGVDGVNVGNSAIPASTALRLDGIPVSRVENMCATGTEALRGAAYAVASGAVDIALAVGAECCRCSPGARTWSGSACATGCAWPACRSPSCRCATSGPEPRGARRGSGRKPRRAEGRARGRPRRRRWPRGAGYGAQGPLRGRGARPGSPGKAAGRAGAGFAGGRGQPCGPSPTASRQCRRQSER